MSEPDITLALQQPWVSIDNDSQGTSPDGLLGQEHPHPRAYGTFPRILRKYVREERRLTLEDAIRKFTSLPAQRMRLGDRGVLKVGMWADVVVFDPATGARPGDVRRAEPAVGGDAVGAGERHPGDRRRPGDGGAAGAGAAGGGVSDALAPPAPPPIVSRMPVDVTSEIGPLADRAGAHARPRARGGDAREPRRLPLRRHHRPRDRPAGASAVRLGAAAIRAACSRCAICSPRCWRSPRRASSSSPRPWTWSPRTSWRSGSARCRRPRSSRC